MWRTLVGMSTSDPFFAYLSDLSQEEGGVHLVPTPFKGKLALASESLDFVKFVRSQEDAALEIPPNVGEHHVADLRGDTWFLPALLVYASSEAVRDAGLAVTLNLIASYIYDRLKKALPGSKPEARIRLFHKTGDDVFEFEYAGPAKDLARLGVPHVASHLQPLHPARDGDPPLLPESVGAPEPPKDERKRNQKKGGRKKKDGNKSKGKK